MDNIVWGHILITVATQQVVVCTIFEIPWDNAGHFFIIYYLQKYLGAETSRISSVPPYTSSL